MGTTPRASVLCLVFACCSLVPSTAALSLAHRKLLQSNWQVVLPWYPTPSNNPNPGSNTSADGTQKTSIEQGTISNATFSNETSDDVASVCPNITLRLLAVEVYHSVIRDPGAVVAVQCSNGAAAFEQATFSTMSYSERGANSARFKPVTAIGKLTCGQALTCRVGAIQSSDPSSWRLLADGGCTFDYRHFTQLSYREPRSAWTCSKPPVRYTLDCIECADPSFRWDDALALSGPPLTEDNVTTSATFNSIMIIVAVTLVSLGILLAVLAVVVRSRRQAAADARVAELVQRVRAQREGQGTPTSPDFKPPEVFEMGEPMTEAPPAGYRGPIVVLNYGEADEEKEKEVGMEEEDEKLIGSSGNEDANGTTHSHANKQGGNGGARDGEQRGRGTRLPCIAIARIDTAASREPEERRSDGSHARLDEIDLEEVARNGVRPR